MKRVTDYFAASPAKKVAAGAPKTSAAAPIPKSRSAWNKDQWADSLPSETRELLDLEMRTMDNSWLEVLHGELTKPYFLNLKRFLKSKRESRAQVFPPENDIYSWSRLTPLHDVKVLILGQDPYHNVGQAHGLAFSVRPPTPVPPSLLNIYKELKSCYPDTFEIPKHGSLVKWAKQGVLMLNACLTVDAHKANSHANRGWEQFTEEVIKAALKFNPHVVVMAWGTPAAKRVERVRPQKEHLVLRSVHPSPLSASRGWFGSAHFPKANEFLEKQGGRPIDWHLLPKKTPAKPSGAPEKSAAEQKEPENASSQSSSSSSKSSQAATLVPGPPVGSEVDGAENALDDGRAEPRLTSVTNP